MTAARRQRPTARIVPFPGVPGACPRPEGVGKPSGFSKSTVGPGISTPADHVPVDSQLDDNVGISTSRSRSYGGAAAEKQRDADLSSPSSPSTRSAGRFSTGRPRHVLDALARELQDLGLHGAHYFVRQHSFDLITRALAEICVLRECGHSADNPPGMLVWLVREAERTEGED